MKPFAHNLNSDNISEIAGYMSCLTDLYLHIHRATSLGLLNNDKHARFIDAAELLERVIATSEEIKEIIKEAMSNKEIDDVINEILAKNDDAPPTIDL